jgi:hypothetical protein
MKKVILTAATLICIVASFAWLASCDKLEDEGMDNERAYYSYFANSRDFDYQDAAAPFNVAISQAVGTDPFLGGNDRLVLDACNECYEALKP